MSWGQRPKQYPFEANFCNLSKYKTHTKIYIQNNMDLNLMKITFKSILNTFEINLSNSYIKYSLYLITLAIYQIQRNGLGD